jgi:hypothetical protein
MTSCPRTRHAHFNSPLTAGLRRPVRMLAKWPKLGHDPFGHTPDPDFNQYPWFRVRIRQADATARSYGGTNRCG